MKMTTWDFFSPFWPKVENVSRSNWHRTKRIGLICPIGNNTHRPQNKKDNNNDSNNNNNNDSNNNNNNITNNSPVA